MFTDFVIPGLGPDLEGMEGSGLGAFPHEVFATRVLDLTRTYANLEIIPAKPNYVPIVGLSRWVIVTLAGTLVTPVTLNAGSDVAKTNFFNTSSTTPSAASVNAAVPPSLASGPINAAFNIARVPNRPVYMDITVPASGTGGFALTARLCTYVQWAPVGNLS